MKANTYISREDPKYVEWVLKKVSQLRKVILSIRDGNSKKSLRIK